jgi:phosphopantothenoylcysteine decarboxylase/phosphopantothenate--cysteine ligase
VPAGVQLVPVGTAEQLRDAVLAAAVDADAVVMAAAVADFRPASVQGAKIKKDDAGGVPEPIALVRNPDVLAEVVAARSGKSPVVVGFAAETGDDTADWLAHGRAKLARKGCDLLVVNRVGEGVGFEVAENSGVLLGADGSEVELPLGSKETLADAVWDAVASRLVGPGR